MKGGDMKKALNEAEATLDRIYEALDATDLTDAEEADLLRDLRQVVQRRDAFKAMLGAG
jgi:hypothetical protein